MVVPVGAKWRAPWPWRFWFKVAIGDGCWEWQGKRDGCGYGMVKSKEHQSQRAHRIAWELWNGPIPAGLNVLHHCDNRPCVRPGHLWLGTQGENIQDAHNKGRNPGKRLWTHCKYGHAFDEANTVWTKTGHRGCRICRSGKRRTDDG